MNININTKITNYDLVVMLARIQAYASEFYGIPQNKLMANDLFKYLIEFRDESIFNINVNEEKDFK